MKKSIFFIFFVLTCSLKSAPCLPLFKKYFKDRQVNIKYAFSPSDIAHYLRTQKVQIFYNYLFDENIKLEYMKDICFFRLESLLKYKTNQELNCDQLKLILTLAMHFKKNNFYAFINTLYKQEQTIGVNEYFLEKKKASPQLKSVFPPARTYTINWEEPLRFVNSFTKGYNLICDFLRDYTDIMPTNDLTS